MPEPVVLLAALAVVMLAGCSSPPIGDFAVGDLRVGGDDTGHAGYERHAVDAGHACGYRRFADRSAAPVAGNAVSIDNFAFAPATLTVAAGSTVTWTNRDEEPHTVVANDGSFHSPGMGSQATYSYTFPTAGNSTTSALSIRSCMPPWW